MKQKKVRMKQKKKAETGKDSSAELEKGKQKTIRGKLIKESVLIIFISLSVVGGISSALNYISTVESLEQTMTETVVIAADGITYNLETYRVLAQELTNNPLLIGGGPKDVVVAECEEVMERNNLASLDVTDARGNSRTGNPSVADEEFFKHTQSTGQPYISDPLVRGDNGEMYIMIASPIMVNEEFRGIIAIGLDASILCEMVSNISIGETGNASMINSKGDTIGYQDVQLVLDAYNTQEELANDSGLAELAAIERKVMAGETGFGSYSYGGVTKYTAYSPIEGTNGWGLYIAVEQNEFLKSTYFGVLLSVLLILISLFTASGFMARLANSIVYPIKLCVDRVQQLAKGDTQSEVPAITTGDETQELAEATGSLVHTIRQVIGDIDYCLTEMAEGNFTVDSKAEEHYIGDFSHILASVRTLNTTLSETLRQIVEVAGQVAQGADQMSQNAQALAEGASDQAGSVEELTATINGVANAAVESAANSLQAYKEARNSADTAETSKDEMQKLVAAMERITETSKEIENIISAIEEIASQTNLLSLNASIEAARAGEAGRGFAVVADQIGKLASDSARSAMDTRELIGKSLEEIEAGNDITLKTAEVLGGVIEGMREFAQVANSSSEDSRVQAESMKEVEIGIEQISSVVQSNSASAEEASATSEELFAQSENLNALVTRFKLKD